MEGNDLLKELEQAEQSALSALQSAQEEDSLKAWQTAHLGAKSAVMQSFKRLGEVPKEQRPLIGQRANQVKQVLETALAERRDALKQAALQRSLLSERLDITLPGRRTPRGRLHPANQTLRQILNILGEMGFQTYLSPDVETDDMNFTLLNMPSYHPARDLFDSFHTNTAGVVLRTHTSPGQIRAMRQFAPEPVRVALPGMCYRYEQISIRHEVQFNQVELLAVGRHITLGDLRGTLEDFTRRMFSDSVRTRFRPSYFPFTEPSAEMDVECFVCGGKGCSMCKGSGWLEILGCGMVHPLVLQNGGYDPTKYTGFAAGMGPERICILQHHIKDIRYFWANDIRFLEQF